MLADRAVCHQNWHLQPWVVGAVSRRDKYGADVLSGQVQPRHRVGDIQREGSDRGQDLASEPDPLDVAVHSVEVAVHSQIGFGDPARQIGGKRCGRARDTFEPAQQPYAARVQRPKIEVAITQFRVPTTDQLERGLPSRRIAIWRAVDRLCEATGGLQPPEDVHAPVAAGHSGVPTDREGHRAPSAEEFVGDLYAGRGRTHHEHAPWWKVGRTPVGGSGHHLDARRETRQAGRYVRPAVWTRGHHDVTGVPGSTVGDNAEPGTTRRMGGRDLQNRRVRQDGCTEGDRVPLEVSEQRGSTQIAIRITAGVAPAGQPGHPARREQVQRVPALATPPIRDHPAVEQHVLTPGAGEEPTDGQPGMSGANDDGVDAGHDRATRVSR